MGPGGATYVPAQRQEAYLPSHFAGSRSTAAPRGRAVRASHDPVLAELTVWTSSQMPHMVRTKLAEWVDFPEHNLRVIAPDVGGASVLKCHIFPEEADPSRAGAPARAATQVGRGSA